jgi:hypothetical protein
MIFSSSKTTIVLPDLLFDILPAVDIDPMPDVILYVLLMSLIFRIIFHPRGLSISRRFMVICGCISFPFTPPPPLTISSHLIPFTTLFSSCGEVVN